jgi:hypothetical protein
MVYLELVDFDPTGMPVSPTATAAS